MIAIDTSAIVAIVEKEDECDVFIDLIVSNDALVGTPTLLEAHMVLSSKVEELVEEFFVEFLQMHSIRPVAFSLNMFQLAQEAFDRYGKGRPRGQRLNFADCMSYAVAKYHDVPLLYKGNDFTRTDIQPALRM